MAIYHLHAQVIQRSKGRNAVAAAAYRHAARFTHEAEKTTWDYTDKQRVIHHEMNLPDLAQGYLASLYELSQSDPVQASECLWNLTEDLEKRIDSQLAREVEFSLPIELNLPQNIELAREFILSQFVAKGMIADWAVHWDPHNPHVHVLLTMREITQEGFGKKVEAWHKRPLLKEWRAQWANHANRHLEAHGFDMRVTELSHEAQGLELVPGIHYGPAAHEMKERGIQTDIFEEVRELQAENLNRIIRKPQVLLDKMSRQRTSFTLSDMGQELGRYVDDHKPFARGEQAALLAHYLEGDDPVAAIEEAPALTPDLIAKVLSSIEQHESVFSERDLAKALNQHTDHSDAFAQALLQLKASPELLYLGPGEDGRDRYTSRTLFNLENEIQTLADELREEQHIFIPQAAIDKALTQYATATQKTLRPEQLEALQHILQPAAISCIVGRAGTGKSFMLGGAKAVFELQGLNVYGIALSGIAADGLTKDVGMDARTIESFRYALAKGEIALDKKSVVIMDEAGMTDSYSMLAVLQAVRKAGAKLLLIGDHGQLQPVGPGAIFRALVERLGYKELQTVYRQQVDWQNAATVNFSQGHVEAALTAYEEQGYLRLAQTPADAREALVHDWSKKREETGKALSEYLVITHTNEDVSALNAELRQARIAKGEIQTGASVQTAGGLIELSEGDRLLFLKNDSRLGVKNGRFATVLSLQLSREGNINQITVELDGNKAQVTFNPEQYKKFTHGYAATVHKTQGVTHDYTFVYAGGWGWNRFLTYVAKTRHRLECTLYADKETHKNSETLKHNLSRYSLKDNVLDFPLAFAERRDIDTTTLKQGLGLHLATRLKAIRNTLSEKYEQIFHKDRFNEQARQQAQTDAQNQALSTRREDARTVAAYVDSHSEVGKAWAGVQAAMLDLEIKEIELGSLDFKRLQKTEEYKHYQACVAQRNALSAAITGSLARYQNAVKINNLSIDKLKNYAAKHHQFERVKAYQQAMLSRKTIQRDKLAFGIYADIKAHYKFIKELDLDPREIRGHATAHDRRKLLIPFSPSERDRFRQVEQYRTLTQQIGAWTKNIIDNQTQALTETPLTQPTPSSPLDETKPAIKQGFAALSEQQLKPFKVMQKQRNALADRIYSQMQDYGPALDFYQFGIASPLLTIEKPTEEQMRYATARYERLEKYAFAHRNDTRVIDYQAALASGDETRCKTLAATICENTKIHHSAILEQNTDPKALWQAIRRDAKAFERDQFFNCLTPLEQPAFITVEQYVAEKRVAGKLWHEIFEHKGEQAFITALDDNESASLAKQHNLRRNECASAIMQNITFHQAGLDYYKLDPKELAKQADKHFWRDLVLSYNDKSASFALRSKIASFIITSPKLCHASVIDEGINWRSIYRDAQHNERKSLFSTLSSDEKIFLRTAQQYKDAHKQVGITWAKINEAKYSDQQKLLPALLKEGRLATARRDQLAAKLLTYKKQIEWATELEGLPLSTAFEFIDEKIKINWDKVAQQELAHRERISQAKSWQQALQDHLKKMEQGLRSAMAIEETLGRDPAYYDDWMSEQTTIKAQTKLILAQIDPYRSALEEMGVSQTVLNKQQLALTKIDVLFDKMRALIKGQDLELILDEEQLKKIGRAKRIEQGTQPIQGTLAERYLREHRGIQGSIPDSYRYHPGVYHGEVKKELPALVVIAKNEKGLTQAVQVIYLDEATANKAKLSNRKLTFGLLSHGQVGVEVSAGINKQHIAVAEGPETALSIREANPELAIYAVLGSSNFARVPLSEETHSVLFCADNDGDNQASLRKLEKAAAALALKGKSVWQAMPQEIKHDFNDTLKQQGPARIREYLKDAICLQKAVPLETLHQEAVKTVTTQQESLPHHKTRLNDFIKNYVQQQLEQTRLVTLMHTHSSAEPELSKSYAQEAKTQRASMEIWLQTALEHPSIKTAIEAHATTHANLAEQGGFLAIHDRIKFDKLTTQDEAALLQHALMLTKKSAFALQQNRDRGGRSQ